MIYIPDRYDIVWLNFTPQAGREQSGVRPALVLSPIEYNKKTSLFIICPITSKVKGYFFEIELENTNTKGVILTDQIKSLDWSQRNVQFKEKISTELYQKVLEKIELLIIE